MRFELISKLKKQRGWTNEDLANASGVPKATIDKITAGTTTNPSFDTIWAIAEALDCTVDQFRATEKSPAPAEAETEEVTESERKQAALKVFQLLGMGKFDDITSHQAAAVLGLVDVLETISLDVADRNGQSQDSSNKAI